MKRFILIFAWIISFVQLPGRCDVYQSSYTATTNLRSSLCPAGQGALLHSICVVDGVATSSAAVYNSSFTISGVQNLSGVIDTSETGKGCFDYDIAAPNGLYADRFGTAGVNILYQCYSRN